MFRSLLCKSGRTLKRSTSIINGESSFKVFSVYITNLNIAIKTSRVTSIFYSYYTTSNNSNLTSSDDDDVDSSFVVNYLLNSCVLSQNEAITVSKKLKFKTTSNPDSVLTLLRTYGFTEPHISKLICRYPAILSSNPHKTLKPKFDFFISRGLSGLELANFITIHHTILRQSFIDVMIHSFDILKSIVQSDENVIKLLRRNPWILSANQVKRLMVNLELLRNEGVPQTKFSKYVIEQPIAFTGDADTFKKIVEKVKDMGIDPLKITFLKAIHGLTSMSEVSWRRKMDVYKRWGWSEVQILSAFRKYPGCMMASEKKIMGVMNFLVNEMEYEPSVVVEYPSVIQCSLKERIIPRCSVTKILVSKGLIKETFSLGALLTRVDKNFLEKFVKTYGQEVPELMKVFQGQVSYQDLLQH